MVYQTPNFVHANNSTPDDEFIPVDEQINIQIDTQRSYEEVHYPTEQPESSMQLALPTKRSMPTEVSHRSDNFDSNQNFRGMNNNPRKYDLQVADRHAQDEKRKVESERGKQVMAKSDTISSAQMTIGAKVPERVALAKEATGSTKQIPTKLPKPGHRASLQEKNQIASSASQKLRRQS